MLYMTYVVSQLCFFILVGGFGRNYFPIRSAGSKIS